MNDKWREERVSKTVDDSQLVDAAVRAVAERMAAEAVAAERERCLRIVQASECSADAYYLIDIGEEI